MAESRAEKKQGVEERTLRKSILNDYAEYTVRENVLEEQMGQQYAWLAFGFLSFILAEVIYMFYYIVILGKMLSDTGWISLVVGTLIVFGFGPLLYISIKHSKEETKLLERYSDQEKEDLKFLDTLSPLIIVLIANAKVGEVLTVYNDEAEIIKLTIDADENTPTNVESEIIADGIVVENDEFDEDEVVDENNVDDSSHNNNNQELMVIPDDWDISSMSNLMDLITEGKLNVDSKDSQDEIIENTEDK